LSAIVGKGCARADEWAAALKADAGVAVSSHPEFVSHFEMRWGPGPSPYRAPELVALASQGTLLQRLAAFTDHNSWEGPTLGGLVSELEEAARSSPREFRGVLPGLVGASDPFRHAVIAGLRSALVAPGDSLSAEFWRGAWDELVVFFEQLIASPGFWDAPSSETPRLVPTREWVMADVAEFLRAGAKTDQRTPPEQLHLRIGKLVRELVSRSAGVAAPPVDPMNHAVNSLKGKAIQAMFDVALLSCRISDEATRSHVGAWEAARPLFESEMAKSKDANFEYSTLAGAYLAQLDYMSPDWVRQNMEGIFPLAHPRNSVCAIDGLAYAPFTDRLHKLLTESGVFDRALRHESVRSGAREHLLQRIAAGYLWGNESLDSPRFSFLFNPPRLDDLEVVATAFWTVESRELSPEQKARVVVFWRQCIGASATTGEAAAKLLSALGILTPYLTGASGQEGELLLAVASYMHVGRNAETFIEQLASVVETDPEVVSRALGKTLKAKIPEHDFQGHLRKLLLRLAHLGKKADALDYADWCRAVIPGVYAELVRLPPQQR
jgi:hypothetical protein